MNMMDMAKMEEAIDQAWVERCTFGDHHHQQLFIKYPDMVPTLLPSFEKGFRAGVAWAMRQEENQRSSQAVGTSSQYSAAVEEPEEEV